MKRWQSIGLGVVISVATLAYALHGNDLNQFGSELSHGRYLYVIPCVALIVLSFYFRAQRWQAILNYQITTTHSFHVINISYFLNSLLPFRLGEVARAFLATRLKPVIPLFVAFSSQVVERLTDLLGLLMILLWAISLNVSNPGVESATRVTAFLVIGGMILLAIFAAHRPMVHWLLDRVLNLLPVLKKLNLRRFIDHLLDGLSPFASVRGLVTVLFWTLLSWAASVLAVFVLLYVFYEHPTWAAALLAVASASIAVAVPVVPGNIGPFEAATVAGLTVAGMVGNGFPPERATAFGIVLHATMVLSTTILGMIGLGQERISLSELIRAIQHINPKVGSPVATISQVEVKSAALTPEPSPEDMISLFPAGNEIQGEG